MGTTGTTPGAERSRGVGGAAAGIRAGGRGLVLDLVVGAGIIVAAGRTLALAIGVGIML